MLHMTVEQLEQTMPAMEYLQWACFLKIEAQEHEEARERMKQQGGR
jgi:hypothetical protein